MKYESFFTDVYSREEAKVIFFGVDYTRDSKKSLAALRKASWFVEPLDAEKKKNLLEYVKTFDVGNIKVKKMEEISRIFQSLIKENKIPFMLSRGHLASYYTTQTLDDETRIIVFDAHFDLQDNYIDELIGWDVPVEKTDEKKFNGSTWLRRLSEIYNPKHIMVLGIRSFGEEELKYAEERGILFYTSYEVKEKIDQILPVIREFTKGSNVYISLDIDVFDPSIAPAVDYPEPDGLILREFKKLVDAISGKIIGFDTCCFKPINDNLLTEFLVVKAIFSLLSRI